MYLIFGVIFLIYLWFCFYLLYRETIFLKIKKCLFLDNVFNMYSLTCYFILFYSVNLIFYFSRFNILIYIHLSVFQVLFLDVIDVYLFISSYDL
jgi:hypothetical protein